MKSRAVILPAYLVVAISMPLWLRIPVLSFLMEFVLCGLVVVMLVEAKYALAAVGAGAALLLGVLPLFQPIPAAFFVPWWLKSFFPAALLGLGIQRGLQAGRSFILASAGAALCMLLIYFQTGGLMAELFGAMGDWMSSFATTSAVSAGYNQERIVAIQDSIASFTDLMIRLLPGMMILSLIGELFVVVVIIEAIYTRLDSYFPGFGPFIYWKMPEQVLYLLGLVVLARLLAGSDIKMVADNLLLILSVFYMVTGLAFMEHLLRRLQLPVLIKIVFYIGLFLMQVPGFVLAAIVGLFDSFFDFRKIKARTLG